MNEINVIFNKKLSLCADSRYQTVRNRKMKQLLILTITILTFVGCGQDDTKTQSGNVVIKTETDNLKTSSVKKNEIQKDKKLDTVVVYWQTEFDTIIEKKMLNIENQGYELELKSFSLNDSSVIRWNDLNKPIIYKDIYHDYVTDLTLTKGTAVILTARINKESFKDSLDGDFYKHSILRRIEYDFTRSNRLYLKAILNVPDTDWMLENEFAIFFRTNKKGQLDYWNFKDIGL